MTETSSKSTSQKPPQFHQQTKSIHSHLFTNPLLASHRIVLNPEIDVDVLRVSKEERAAPVSGEPQQQQQNQKSFHNTHGKQQLTNGRTSQYILKKSLQNLSGASDANPLSLSQLHYQFERAQRILHSTGIFQEVKVELDDDDLLGDKKLRQYLGTEATPHASHTKVSQILGQDKDIYGRPAASHRNPMHVANSHHHNLSHLHHAKARITAVERPGRHTMGLGVSMTMDGDTEVQMTAAYRNLFKLADVTSLSVTGTNASFNDLLHAATSRKTDTAKPLSWRETLLSPKLMWSLSWKVPFICGEMFTARVRAGTEAIHETDFTQHSQGFELHSQLNPKHSLEYAYQKRNLLIGGNYRSTMQQLGGPKDNVTSSLRHTYMTQELSRDQFGSPNQGYSVKVENTLAASRFLGLGDTDYVKSQVEANSYFSLFGTPFVGSINAKVGAVAPFTALSSASRKGTAQKGELLQDEDANTSTTTESVDDLSSLYVGDRVFSTVRGFNNVGSLTYVEEMQNGKSTFNAYQSKGGNVAASATARLILPFHAVPALSALHFIYAQGFIGAGNTVSYDFRSRFNYKDFSRGMFASYGAGIFIPIGGARIELNYATPLLRPSNELGADKNFQRVQVRFFFDW